MAGFCKHDDEPLGSTKVENLFGPNFQDPIPWS